MDTESTPSAGFSTIDEAVKALQDSRQKPEEQPEPETAPADTEVESEEIPDEVQQEEVTDEGDEIEPGEDVSDEADEEAETESDEEAEDEVEGEDLYEVEGETFTLSELQEWKKNGLRQSDYTRKTQEIARDREGIVAERESFEAERAQVQEHLQQQQARLQEALTVFAIEQPDPPKRSDFSTVDEYITAQEGYQQAEQRKTQAQQMHQALQAEQMQATRKREASKAMQYFPDWATDEGFNSAVKRMSDAASEFGFSQDEILNGGLSDHRTFRILNELADLRDQLGERDARRKAAAKKVTKATKRLTPGSKSTETGSQTELRKARQALKNTGSKEAAVALMRARRKG